MYELIHANCIDVLCDMSDRSVDCIVTDMPYGVGVDFGEYRDNVENLEALIDPIHPASKGRLAHRGPFSFGRAPSGRALSRFARPSL
jgi:DNA modification methylase